MSEQIASTIPNDGPPNVRDIEQLAPANSSDVASKRDRSRSMNPEPNPGTAAPDSSTSAPKPGANLAPGLNSVTRKYRTPDGTVYVTVAGDGDETWIDCTVGKGGTALQASAHALAALAGTALRCGTPADKVACCLRGVTHERSVRFGNDALSVPDALGLAIQAGP